MYKYLFFLPSVIALSAPCEQELNVLQCVESCPTYAKDLGYISSTSSCSETTAATFINRQCCSCGGGATVGSSLLHVDGVDLYVPPVCADEPVYPLSSEYSTLFADAQYGGVSANWKFTKTSHFYLLFNNYPMVHPETGVSLGYAPSIANKVLLSEDNDDVPFPQHTSDAAKYTELTTMKREDLKTLRVRICNITVPSPGDVIVLIYSPLTGACRDTGQEWYCSRETYTASSLHTIGGCADIVVPIGDTTHPNLMNNIDIARTLDTGVTMSIGVDEAIMSIALHTNTVASDNTNYILDSYQINDIHVNLV